MVHAMAHAVLQGGSLSVERCAHHCDEPVAPTAAHQCVEPMAPTATDAHQRVEPVVPTDNLLDNLARSAPFRKQYPFRCRIPLPKKPIPCHPIHPFVEPAGTVEMLPVVEVEMLQVVLQQDSWCVLIPP